MAALTMVVSGSLAEPAQQRSRPGDLKRLAFTRVSDLRQMSFTRPGRIEEVFVEEGDTVKAGAVLVQLDDSIEQEEMVILQILAADPTRIDFANAALEKAQVDLAQAQELFEKDSATRWELREAELEVKLKAASLEIAKIEQRQAQANRDQLKIRLKHMQLIAPMSGRVERIILREGESADALEKVIVIVQTDPLWVDVPVPIANARPVRIGQKALVRYPGDTGDDAAAGIVGTVIHKASVADAASGTLTVRVEFANAAGRPAGEYVKVTFDAGAAMAPAK